MTHAKQMLWTDGLEKQRIKNADYFPVRRLRQRIRIYYVQVLRHGLSGKDCVRSNKGSLIFHREKLSTKSRNGNSLIVTNVSTCSEFY